MSQGWTSPWTSSVDDNSLRSCVAPPASTLRDDARGRLRSCRASPDVDLSGVAAASS
jgi:hypothetical protein